jgi:hypothetical protein
MEPSAPDMPEKTLELKTFMSELAAGGGRTQPSSNGPAVYCRPYITLILRNRGRVRVLLDRLLQKAGSKSPQPSNDSVVVYGECCEKS